MEKKCTICGKSFASTRSWSKYCSNECKNKANSLRVIKHRKKHDPLKVKTIDELKTKEPYKTNYEKIMTAIGGISKLDEKTKEEIKKSADRIDLKNFGVCKPPKTKERLLKSLEKRISKRKITWPYLIEETELSPDTLSKYIKVMRKLGIMKEKGFDLGEKHRFEPLKIWYKDFIMNCPAFNTWSFYNSTLFHKKISTQEIENRKIWEDEDITNFKVIMEKLSGYYFDMAGLFDKIGLKKAEIMWSKFINDIEALPAVKFYFCIKLIEFHYLNSLRPEIYCKIRKMRDIISNGSSSQKRIDALTDELYSVVTGDELQKWKSEFTELLNSAFKRYMKKEKIPYSTVFQDEILRYDKDFNEMCRRTVITRTEMKHFLAVLHPAFLASEELEVFEKVEKDIAVKIDDAVRYANLHPQLSQRLKSVEDNLSKKVKIEISRKAAGKKIPIVKHESKLNFFEEKDFFVELVDEIKALGYDDKKEFCYDLMPLANAFEVPRL